MAVHVGIELGGTRTRLGFGSGPEDLSGFVELQTTSPDETLGRVVAEIRAVAQRTPVVGVGVASFGPIGLTPGSADWGRILSTPKSGWSGTPVANLLSQALDLPVAVTTDVAGAALAEGRWGVSRGLGLHAYVTVGTGIGVGLVRDGRPMEGVSHPEAGHIFVARERAVDPFDGVCPFHGDCLEGLASGPAVATRAGRPGEELEPDDPVWPIVADYLAQLMVTLTLTVSPERIVVGGGLGRAPGLLARVRHKTARRLNGYAPHVAGDVALQAYLSPPGLGTSSGVLGALLLSCDAEDAMRRNA